MAFLIAAFAILAVSAGSSSAYDSILDGGFEDTATSLELLEDFNSTEHQVSSSANLVVSSIPEFKINSNLYDVAYPAGSNNNQRRLSSRNAYSNHQ